MKCIKCQQEMQSGQLYRSASSAINIAIDKSKFKFMHLYDNPGYIFPDYSNGRGLISAFRCECGLVMIDLSKEMKSIAHYKDYWLYPEYDGALTECACGAQLRMVLFSPQAMRWVVDQHGNGFIKTEKIFKEDKSLLFLKNVLALKGPPRIPGFICVECGNFYMQTNL